MSYKPFSLDGQVGDTTVQTIRAAANPGSPNNERIVMKRLRIVNFLAAGGATVTVTVWKGASAGNAQIEAPAITIAPGQVKEWDPTFMVLEPGESLYWQTSVATACSVGGDGAVQNE